MVKNMDKIKFFFTIVLSTILSALGILSLPVLLLVTCNIIDYITGLIAAGYRMQTVDSYKSIKGITRKVCMWLLVVVGVIIDQLLAYTSSIIGLAMPFAFFVACVVAVWLICNELISILENIADIGVALPPFLVGIVKRLKLGVEQKVNSEEKEK